MFFRFFIAKKIFALITDIIINGIIPEKQMKDVGKNANHVTCDKDPEPAVVEDDVPLVHSEICYLVVSPIEHTV